MIPAKVYIATRAEFYAATDVEDLRRRRADTDRDIELFKYMVELSYDNALKQLQRKAVTK